MVEISWDSIRKYLPPLVIIILGIIGWFWLQTPNLKPTSVPSEIESSLPLPNAVVTIYITGKVATPGVVELPVGSRVIDAIKAAGGMLIQNPDLNLARVLVDGEQVTVGRKTSQKSAISDGKIDLNTANQTELETISGVGPVMASRILEYRETNGNFKSISDLDAISGIGPSLLAELEKIAIVR